MAPELEYYVILRWGDRPFPDWTTTSGYNHDSRRSFRCTSGGVSDGMLWVNHEYVSFPFSGTDAGDAGRPRHGGREPDRFEPVIGFPLPDREEPRAPW